MAINKERHLARMADFKRQLDAGQKRAVLHALGECVCGDPEKPIPQWVKQAFLEAMHEVSSAKVRSWDDVFGRPLEKGKHLNARRRHLRLRERVWRECMERRADGAAIDENLFGEVAEKLRISKSDTSGMFYEVNPTRPVVERGRRFKGAPVILPPKI